MAHAAPPSDLAGLLAGHDRWANALIVERCRSLSDKDVHKDMGVGVGSLHDQLVHTALVLGIWTDVLLRTAVRSDPADLPWDIERIAQEINEGHDAFETALASGPDDEVFTRTYREGERRLTRASVAAHVATHNAHHRAQCLHMLKQLGMTEPLPASVMSWQWSLISPAAPPTHHD